MVRAKKKEKKTESKIYPPAEITLLLILLLLAARSLSARLPVFGNSKAKPRCNPGGMASVGLQIYSDDLVLSIPFGITCLSYLSSARTRRYIMRAGDRKIVYARQQNMGRENSTAEPTASAPSRRSGCGPQPSTVAVLIQQQSIQALAFALTTAVPGTLY